ncbi:creatininase family protein [Chloroflexota bacterium]
MTVRLDEMSWVEIKEVLSKHNIVVWPIGSTEEHGAHLPVNIDALCTTYAAEKAAKKVMDETGITVLVAPTMPYGEVSLHKMFPGTIGIKADTLIKVIIEVVKSFLEQGFNNLIALTGHRENSSPIDVALTMVADDYPEANIFGVNTMGLGFDVRPGLVKAGLAGMGHALEVETSQAMVYQPQNVHLERAIVGSIKLPISERYIGATGKDKTRGVIYCSGVTGFEESGTFGNPSMSCKETGEKIMTAQVNDLADIIMQVAKLDKRFC